MINCCLYIVYLYLKMMAVATWDFPRLLRHMATVKENKSDEAAGDGLYKHDCDGYQAVLARSKSKAALQMR